MIVVKVELWSAITGKKLELARMEICNEWTSTNGRTRSYSCRTLKGRSTEQLNKRVTQRAGGVSQYPSLAIHVWHLVSEALKAMKYDNRGKKEK